LRACQGCALSFLRTRASQDTEPVFLSVDIGTNWVVSVSANGEVLLLADHPQLSLLTRFYYTCTGEPVDEMMDAEGDHTGAAAARTAHDASSSTTGALVGTHIVTDGLPLSNVFVLSALQRGSRECCVRVHGLLRMICMFAEQAETDADGSMLKCVCVCVCVCACVWGNRRIWSYRFPNTHAHRVLTSAPTPVHRYPR
jgi:hypothetical protein